MIYIKYIIKHLYILSKMLKKKRLFSIYCYVFEIYDILYIELAFLSKSNCFELLVATGLFEIQLDLETQFPHNTILL